ncbi:hypothetical protein Taro_031223, partial [Colocasia esculenta]|nr:hypothetical protein [Colocasia esculenta]
SFPTEPVTREAHPPTQVRESRRPHTRRLVLSRTVAEGLHHRQCNLLFCCTPRAGSFIFLRTSSLISLARLRPGHGRRARVRHVIGLTGLNNEDRHSFSRGCYCYHSHLPHPLTPLATAEAASSMPPQQLRTSCCRPTPACE